MRATLQLIASQGMGRRFEVRQGQIARFGKTEWADFRIPDETLADVHFSVECQATGCVLRPVANDRPVAVNSQRATAEVPLKNGDRIEAGHSILLVKLDGEVMQHAESEPAPAAPVETGPARMTTAEWTTLLGYLDVDEAARGVPQDGQTADEALDALIGAEQFAAAGRLVAHWLGPRAAVWWGCCCLESLGLATLATPQHAAWAAARDWALAPTEANRRQAERALHECKGKGPGGALSVAAYCGGGSLAPPNNPEPVSPDPRANGQAVAAALTVASVLGAPNETTNRWLGFLRAGRDLLDGKTAVPDAPPA